MYKIVFSDYINKTDTTLIACNFKDALKIGKMLSEVLVEKQWTRTYLTLELPDNYTDIFKEGHINIQKL